MGVLEFKSADKGGRDMREQGLVMEIENDQVVIQLARTSACDQCGACSMGAHDQEMLLRAENQCNAKPGDHVYLELQQENFFKAVSIMYGLPLVGLIIGFLAGYGGARLFGQSNWQEPLGLLGGIGLMIVIFFWIRSQEERWKTKDYRPIAVEVVSQRSH